MTRHHHDLFREGIIAGMIGAVAVAAWFFVTDLAQGRPLSTPSVLGQVLLFRLTDPVVSPAQLGPTVAYTLLHIGAFMLFGIALTQLVHLAMGSPLARFGLLIMGVVFELFFFFVTLALFEGTSYLFPWWSVLGANTIALVGMGFYLIRRHPGLKRQFSREPLGA